MKAGFRQLLVEEFGTEIDAVRFEHRVQEVRGRLDALVGHTIFEAKRDLDAEWRDVERRMPEYLADRERAEGERFVGIASDGRLWVVTELQDGKLAVVKRTILDPDKGERFLAWLDGALALKSSLPPDPLTIRAELGQDSLAFHRVDGEMRALWGRLKSDPAVALKRDLWAELLKQVYGREVEGDDLWFQHSFLVVVAKCIALAVMGLPEDDPTRLLSGEAFKSAGIHGAVESDFFDWVVADADGQALVRRIMAHVRRFRLSEVESDVLKILYESLIDRDERHGLGEYYTPDWLAAKVVRHAVDRPLEQRVMDPACGSGTFLFHAIRHFLAEAEEAGLEPDRRALEACGYVAGTDIHPVAVIIARVTYLLALAPALSARTGELSIPVYLGDAMQLSISEFMAGKELTIRVPPPPAGEGRSGAPRADGREQLDFPDTFCRDPALFDKAIERMRTGSEQGMTRAQIEKALYRITEQHYRADVTREQELAIQDLGKTYVTFDRLRREGRDTVWAYVARNLSRPLAYSAGGGWAQVVVGNPPWVAFRHMNPVLQKRFKELSKGEKLYSSRSPSHNDLCALFSVRAAHLYLRSGGKLAFVLPMAALTRSQFDTFRKGSFHSVRIAWEEVWSMDESVHPLFPVPSCVLFGRKRAVGQKIPESIKAFKGALPLRDASEEIADRFLRVSVNSKGLSVAQATGGSVYREMFRQGAILVPRMLCFVERKQSGRLGSNPSAPLVVSRRSNQEKMPWKEAAAIENRVERDFLRPILLGESITPFRVMSKLEAVVPATESGIILDSEGAANRGFSDLFAWLKKAEYVWDTHNKSERTLTDQLNYIGQLSSQFPVNALRVIYAKAGKNPACAIIRDDRAIIDHKLYWYAPANELEAFYLTAILNSEALRQKVEHYQSRGQWGARDFDKVAFNLPIPRFDPDSALHLDLADAAKRAEDLAALVELPDGIPFQRARAQVRRALTDAGIATEIDGLVERLLDDTA
ncbi:N-6 DNA methylase [Azospirillum sp. B510]|uniref:N-6 DNA methylase n=1 Tax=Azospirillum sp. (strain B510) TaxID=137722 RepID=UPI0013051C56|nr:N-6 DNA methylase [Azospirillum sp. B510]